MVGGEQEGKKGRKKENIKISSGRNAYNIQHCTRIKINYEYIYVPIKHDFYSSLEKAECL